MQRKCNTCECDLHEFSESKGNPGLCRACYAAYFRGRYQIPLVRKKQRARIEARIALEKGIIEKRACCLCGCSDSEMHHGDYNKPTDVSWMCDPCHTEYHSLERKVYAAAVA